MLHPRGLVPKSKGLRCQFRGDWSQWMASFTSESDSNAFAASLFIFYFFFSVLLRRWIAPLRIRESLRRDPRKVKVFPGCVSINFLLAVCQFPFVSSQWLLWRKVTNGKCGSSFVYKHEVQFNFKWLSVVLWLCKNCILSYMQIRSYCRVTFATRAQRGVWWGVVRVWRKLSRLIFKSRYIILRSSFSFFAFSPPGML